MNDETREALIERIEHVEHDPCGRNTELYGPSRTENSILELCQAMKELINDVCQNYRFDSNGKPDPTKEAQTYTKNLQEVIDELAEKGELYIPEQNSNKLIKCKSAKVICESDNIRPGYISLTIEGALEDHEMKLIKKVTIPQLINQVFSEVKGPIDDPNAAKRFEGLINNKIRSIAMSNDTVLTATYNDEERVLRDTAEVEYIGEVEDRGHRFMLIGHLDDWTLYEGFFTIYSTAQFISVS